MTEICFSNLPGKLLFGLRRNLYFAVVGSALCAKWD